MSNYELIPFDQIDTIARDIAVKWVEHFSAPGMAIQDKHKLASDIMNYAQSLRSENDRLKSLIEQAYEYGAQANDLGYSWGEFKHKFKL